MFNFPKKKADDDEFEELNDGRALSRRSKRDEISSEIKAQKRTRIKKEQKKPWTKKERILIFLVLLLTSLASAFLGLSSRGFKLPNQPRIKLPDIKFEKTYTLEANKPANLDSEELKKSFTQLTNPLTGIYGLYVLRLNTAQTYGINENETFEAASLIKLPVMTALLMEEEAGNISLDDVHVLKENDKLPGAGSLSSAPEGTQITFEELIIRMGNQSDNTALNITKNILGEEKINSTISSIGMRGTSFEKNTTTPSDIGKFFTKLETGKLLNPKNTQLLLKSLTNTIYEDWLRAGVPSNIKVSHKYGRELNVVNDAGIVYSPSPYIVVIMTKGVILSEADNAIPELSRLIWNFENSS